jgi:hypothetical protein
MSVSSIRASLEKRLLAIDPDISTAWENVKFTPANNIPYQSVYFLFADPSQTNINQDYAQGGYMQVSLFYPLMQGSAAAMRQAQKIRDGFKVGTKYDDVIINKTPKIGSGRVGGDRYMVPVHVFFISYIAQ